MAPPEAGQSILEKLPSEILIEILSFITDIRTLVEATCSSITLYHTSTEAQGQIVPRVVSQMLDDEILPEAIAVLHSSKSPWSKPTAQRFLNETLAERKTPKHSWTLDNAVPVSRLYHQITKLATDFSLEASSFFGHTVSTSELNRFKRAFYRYELYCNIFGPKNPLMTIQEQTEAFFSHFSSAENEQLACVHDYLHRLMIPDFNELVKHDVHWGAIGLNCSELDDPEWQLLAAISHGINNVLKIMDAEGYDQKYPLFFDDMDNSFIFLHEAVEDANLGYSRDLTESSDVEIANLSRSYFQDPDSGPFDAWYSAHKHLSDWHIFRFANNELNLSQRRWGYVMWDRATLDKMGFLLDDWQQLDSIPDIVRYKFDFEARERREYIWNQGGIGWWSKDDESKINWERRDKKIADRARVRAEMYWYDRPPSPPPRARAIYKNEREPFTAIPATKVYDV